MSLIVGVPFAEGFVVVGDKARQYGGPGTKLHKAGGALFSVTGDAEHVHHVTHQQLFHVAGLVALHAPERLERHHLPALADAAVESAPRYWAGIPTRDQVARVVFWFHRSISTFLLSNANGVISHSDVEHHEIDPDRCCSYLPQGGDDYVELHVIKAGRLLPVSYAFMAARKPVRDVSAGEALSLALDIQGATDRTTKIIPPPGPLGGGVDVFVVRESGPEELRPKTSTALAGPPVGNNPKKEEKSHVGR